MTECKGCFENSSHWVKVQLIVVEGDNYKLKIQTQELCPHKRASKLIIWLEVLFETAVRALMIYIVYHMQVET